MSMRLVSEFLLKNEINRYKNKDKLEPHEKMLCSICEKELAVLEKLKIDYIDLRGETEEVINRLNDEAVYIMHPDEFMEMLSAVDKYNKIKKILEE